MYLNEVREKRLAPIFLRWTAAELHQKFCAKLLGFFPQLEIVFISPDLEVSPIYTQFFKRTKRLPKGWRNWPGDLLPCRPLAYGSLSMFQAVLKALPGVLSPPWLTCILAKEPWV